MFGENTSGETRVSVTGYATLCSHFLETPCGRLVFGCLSSALVTILGSGQWVPLLEGKLKREGERERDVACLFSPSDREPFVTQTVLRAQCASKFAEECLLSTHCVPDTYVISFHPYLISKTSLWIVDTLFPFSRWGNRGSEKEVTHWVHSWGVADLSFYLDVIPGSGLEGSRALF